MARQKHSLSIGSSSSRCRTDVFLRIVKRDAYSERITQELFVGSICLAVAVAARIAWPIYEVASQMLIEDM
jgi:hypothetical protein